MHRVAAGSLAVALAVAVSSPGPAVTIESHLKDGRILRGSPGYTSGLLEQPQPSGKGVVQSIRFLDDRLRRVYFSRRQIAKDGNGKDREYVVAEPAADNVFSIWQQARTSGVGLDTVGPILHAEPFDAHGRRTVRLAVGRQEVDVVQGITELAPGWAKVEGITPYVWDMRIRPSSLPGDTLDAILHQYPEADQVEHQKKIVRFYVEMQRYDAALATLERLAKSHPDDAQVKQSIERWITDVRQLAAEQILGELKLRRDAGQHGLVAERLKTFPSENVAGNLLLEVRDISAKYDAMKTQRTTLVEQLRELLAKTEDLATRESLVPVVEEIASELDFETLPRLAAFRLAAGDADMQPAEKLALAASGWLLGTNAATPNVQVALSAWRVRGLVRQYLVESQRIRVEPLLEQLGAQEAAVPKTVALLLAHMKPPEASEPLPGRPGYFELEIPGLEGQPAVRYVVQLPPEYNPYRRYPVILTLHGAGGSPELQVDWWAGPVTEGGWRRGQASRHGYIVVAPAWTAKQQASYGYSADEHVAVLRTLRDACRRFSIDTDRVFLSGHWMGGDAAWDISLAHPDLWAGVIPISARSDRYCSFYRDNARHVPFYFVGGEKDALWFPQSATDMDYYLNHGFNVTVVEYLGRGPEDFYDEIHNLFDWMAKLKRDFFFTQPPERGLRQRRFECVTMRPWDNFFWWVEVDDLPARAMVAPNHWPPPRGTFAMQTESAILDTNGVRVRTGAGKVVVWLAPEMVDFQRRITVLINSRPVRTNDPALQPNLETLLEDARTRVDRQHPFWTKVEVSTGRG